MSKTENIDKNVDRKNLSATATITGQSYVAGEQTRIGNGVVIRNSYLENMVIEDGVTLVDSILIGGEAKPGSAPAEPKKIGAGSVIRNSLLHDTSIGAGSTCDRCAVLDSTLGNSNLFKEMYGKSLFSKENVTIKGPTEAAGAWLGRGTYIDQCGFFSAMFSNDFHVFEFNRQKGIVEVKETIDIPHVSRYGMNVIDSGNSGNIKNQDGGALKSIGPHVGLWHDRLLQGASLKHSPLCFVSPWTKVVGKSARRHPTPADLIQNTLATHLMPFSVSGFDGDSVMGQVIIGEQNNAYNYKKRIPGWIFSYAPDAVINTVRRLREAGADRSLADNIVKLSLRNAIELLYVYAHERSIDLDAARDGKGWTGWLVNARRIYEFHLNSGLWEFKDGEPLSWRFAKGRWKPRKEDGLLKLAPDALMNQVSETEILHCPEKKLQKQLGVTAAELKPTLKPAHIGAAATVSPTAWIGPGVQVLGKSVIKDNVRLFRTVVKDSVIEDGACFYNSVFEKSAAGSRVQGRCVLLRSSKIGSGSVADCARIEKSDLSERSTLYPFAHVKDSTIENPCIVGTTVKNADVRSFLMTYHMPGYAENLDVEPVEITYEGKTHAIRIIPMLGGGMRILGRKGKRVSVSCSFVGSNAIIEAGAYIGFGCFVLGRLSGAEGLPPFTLSTEAGPEKDQIGAVASNFPHIIISHFIQWTYQSNGIEQADSVARMVPCMLSEGRNAVHAEIERRTAGKRSCDNKSFGRYKSLKLYTLEQLKAGLETYDNELSDGRWLMKYVDGELRFSGSGKWTITDGAARWEKAQTGN